VALQEILEHSQEIPLHLASLLSDEGVDIVKQGISE
jgi:hypothetical protein